MSNPDLIDEEPDDDDLRAPVRTEQLGQTLVPHLRCFVDYTAAEEERENEGGNHEDAGDCVLVFDTETTVDVHQRVRIVAWRLIRCGSMEIRAWGIAYNAEALAVSVDQATRQQAASDAIALIKQYCEEQGGIAETLEEWIEKRFLRYGFQWKHTIVGFNLFFDLTRLAQEARPAVRNAFGRPRGKPSRQAARPKANFYHDGFSMVFHSKPFMPGLKAKKLGRHKFSYRWASNSSKKPWAGRGGSFIDAQTVGLALRKPRASLAAMCEAYRDNMSWLRRDYVFKDFAVEHGEPITRNYLDYAIGDVRDTAHLYFALCAEYAKHQLDTPLAKIFSEASLGKAYYRQLGIKPFLQAHAAFPKEYIGYGMQAFYGGRCDVRYRCEPVEVAYCDFTSQYPTINALLGLQDYHIATAMRVEHGIHVLREVADLLREIEQSDFAALLEPDFWRRLRYFVKIKPVGDILPLRTNFGDQVATNVGLAQLFAGDSHEGSWFTIQHVIGSMLLLQCREHAGDEKPAPLYERLLDAFIIEPGAEGVETQPITLFGEVPIDLKRDDLFTTVIEQRSRCKTEMKRCARGDPEHARLKSIEQGLKLLANATSYGILVEVNESEFSTPVDAILYADKTTHIRTKVIDEAGRNFMGPLGALITSSGWLLLAMAEHWADRFGLRIAACDTDGFMVARPDGVSRDEFVQRVDRLCRTFDALNPYDPALIPHLVKIEDENFDSRTRERQALYGYFVSSKRYALFNIEEIEGRKVPVVRKASMHGTGNLQVPHEALRQLRIDASALRAGLSITPSHLRSLRENGGFHPPQLLQLRYGEDGSHPADTFSEIHGDYSEMGWQQLWWLINLYSLANLLPPDHIAETRALDVPQIAQVTIATWTIYEQYGEKLGIAPGGFIGTLPALAAQSFNSELIEFPDYLDTDPEQYGELYKRLNGQGFYAPFRGTFDDLRGEVRSLADPALRVVLKRPVTIQRALGKYPGYFTRPEHKAANPDGIGWLARRTCAVSSPKFIGKETSRQADTAAESGQDIRENDARVLAGPAISVEQQRFVVEWLTAATPVDRDRLARVALPGIAGKAARPVLTDMKNNRLDSKNEKWRLVRDALMSEAGRAAMAFEYAKDIGLNAIAAATEKDGWPELLRQIAPEDIAAAAGVKVGLAKQWKAGSKAVPWRAHEALAPLVNRDDQTFEPAPWRSMIADFIASLPLGAVAANEIAAIAGVTRLQADAIARGGLPPTLDACVRLVEATQCLNGYAYNAT